MKTHTSLLITLGVLLICRCEAPSKADATKTKAEQIHKNVMTLDTHDDINVANFTPEKNYTQNLPTQVNLPKMNAGGLDVAWFIVYTGQGELNEAGYSKAMDNAVAKFEAIKNLTTIYAPDQIGLATSAKEARELWKAGKKVAMIGVENAYPLGLDTTNVKKFYDWGARYMSLAHNGHSQFSDSNTGEYSDPYIHQGISKLGKQVIERMNYYGMMVDISHPSKESIRQTIEHSKAPVVASHSAARAISDHPRNLDDEQLKWIKESGGVVQTVALALYVNKEKHEKHQSARDSVLKNIAGEKGLRYLSRREAWALSHEEQKVYRKEYESLLAAAEKALIKVNETHPPVDVADFVDQIDYLVEKLGVDQVGIASDFDGGGGVEGWQDASESLNVTLELMNRGYTETEIEKIWSGNLLRLLDEVEKVADELQQQAR